MIERVVMQTRKTPTGVVTALVNRGEEWSPRLAEDVVEDIRSGRVRYVVPWYSGRVVVRVIDGPAMRLDAARPDGGEGGLALLPDG
jgi:hypothetical protein